MNVSKNKTLTLLGGIALFVAGLFWFCNVVSITNGFFSYGFRIGHMSVSTGAVFIPLIVAIVLVVMNPAKVWRKIFLCISGLFIVMSVILSTRLHLAHLSLFEWVSILVLIFGGGALICKSLFGKN